MMRAAVFFDQDHTVGAVVVGMAGMVGVVTTGPGNNARVGALGRWSAAWDGRLYVRAAAAAVQSLKGRVQTRRAHSLVTKLTALMNPTRRFPFAHRVALMAIVFTANIFTNVPTTIEWLFALFGAADRKLRR